VETAPELRDKTSGACGKQVEKAQTVPYASSGNYHDWKSLVSNQYRYWV